MRRGGGGIVSRIGGIRIRHRVAPAIRSSGARIDGGDHQDENGSVKRSGHGSVSPTGGVPLANNAVVIQTSRTLADKVQCCVGGLASFSVACCRLENWP